jgi:protoporphyrin/coproporphyrin ferrochelatase
MKTAVVLYNLGGPDSPEAVQPFLFNLFNDPAIMRQPAPIRWLLAKLISSRRAPVAQKIYAEIGGSSPILPETQKQADALEAELKKTAADGDIDRVFIAMRYWHPFAEECIAKITAWQPDRVVLMPLYPQFSTTTTESFLSVWGKLAKKAGIMAETSGICCYPAEDGFINAVADLVRPAIAQAEKNAPARVLFSAHGIPKKFVAAGDPYQSHVEMTVAAIVKKLDMPELDHLICYQSRVGPIEWLKPYTDHAITEAAKDGKAIIVVPIAFVSEHSETLVELDIEYAKLATENDAKAYIRVQTVGATPKYIEGLAAMVREASSATGIIPHGGARICLAAGTACPCAAVGA